MPHTLKPIRNTLDYDPEGWTLLTADGRTHTRGRFSINVDVDEGMAQDWADEILGGPQDWRRAPDDHNRYCYEAA